MAVVLSREGRVLLHRRELFWLWDLPGGAIEKGERDVDAVVREAREETGYEISVDRLVGVYYCQSVSGLGDQRTHAFRAHVVGGAAKRFGLETSGLRWCSIAELPNTLQPLHRQIIADALADAAEPFERRIDFPRWQLYPARVAFFVMGARNALVRRLL